MEKGPLHYLKLLQNPYMLQTLHGDILPGNENVRNGKTNPRYSNLLIQKGRWCKWVCGYKCFTSVEYSVS